MLSNDLKYVNVAIKIEVYMAWKFKTFNYQFIFLNFIFSLIYGANFTRFGRHVAKDHSEGTMSQIFDLGPSSYFMKSRKLSSKK